MDLVSKEEFYQLVSQMRVAGVPVAPGLGDCWVLFNDGSLHKAESMYEEYVITSLRGRGGMATHIDRTEIGPFVVSTVFLSMNHAWGILQTPPILFETMLFREDVGAGSGQIQKRYSSLKAAKDGHRKVVRWINSFSEHRPSDIISPNELERDIVRYFYNKNKAP